MPLRKRAAAFQSRSAQVADYIRELIRSGQWEERLPAERLMAAQIGVSRDTVRDALALLEEEGLVTERTRGGTRVRNQSRSSAGGPVTVGILVLMKMEQTTYRTLAWVDELRRHLYQKQIAVEIYDGYPAKRGFFQKIASRAHHDCWVLVYPNHDALEWCIRERVRAVVVGTIPDALGLPSVDIHYRALCRHAVGGMVHLGHRRLALILHRREWGADAESVAGFQEGAAASKFPGVTGSVHYHNGTPAGLCALADRLLAMKPRPTAWIVAVAPHFLTVLMHLQRKGVAVPGEISLVSQDAEPWQHFASPEPTRYVADVSLLARVTAREVLRSLSGNRRAIKPRRILPELKLAKTLAAPPG